MLPDKKQILEVITNSNDYSKTQVLISEFDTLKKRRKEFYLTKSDLEKILKWKLRDQYSRQTKIRLSNTDEIIEKITKTAFSIRHQKSETETEFKIEILTSLKGVGIPVASSILTLCYPENYGVIDFRNWRWLFKEKRNHFSINNYKKYLNVIRNLAKDKNLTPQEIDFYIWESDKNSTN